MPYDAQPSTISLLKQLFHFIKPRRRMQFGLLILLSIVTSFSEVISLGAVVPFLAVLSDPSRVFSHPAGQSVARFFSITEASGLLLPLTLGFILSALLSGTLRLILLWITIRLSVASGAELSYDIYHRSLYQPYSVHIRQNSSDRIVFDRY